jgi:hypothetical protein
MLLWMSIYWRFPPPNLTCMSPDAAVAPGSRVSFNELRTAWEWFSGGPQFIEGHSWARCYGGIWRHACEIRRRKPWYSRFAFSNLLFLNLHLPWAFNSFSSILSSILVSQKSESRFQTKDSKKRTEWAKRYTILRRSSIHWRTLVSQVLRRHLANEHLTVFPVF